MAKGNSVDLSKLSIEDMEALAKEIEIEITTRRQAEKDRVLQQMRELAASIGATPESLFGKAGKAGKPAAKEVAVKYRHPDDPSQTWTGRGKRPLWVVQALAGGKTLDDLAVE